ncbi:MAG TPA: hypothetical protein VD963_08195 [Phycisphaerales bacterium]|nr:hypothetical protein [Phycisphaerales bacterium]
MSRLFRPLPGLALAAAAVLSARASDCTQTSVGRVPLNDLGAGLYLGQFQGGLYPGGANLPPAAHAAEGLSRAAFIGPLDLTGQPDPAGKYVLLSIGMSNTTQEFCSAGSGLPCDPYTFMGQAAAHPLVNHTSLEIVNGAAGGQAASTWDSPADPNYDRVRDTRLAPRGLGEAQVRAVWLKVANPGPSVSLPAPNADAYTLVTQMGNIVRAAKVRYPNLEIVFVSSRIYAGYASSTLNPEPYAYESGFAVKWLIEAQINQMAGGPIDPRAGDLDTATVAPWIAWGPYLWADGTTPRSDGLTWVCADFSPDGTHPATSGRQKVGTRLLQFMLASPFARPWFRLAGACSADFDASGTVTTADITAFLGAWFADLAAGGTVADFDLSGATNTADISMFLSAWFAAVAGGCP